MITFRSLYISATSIPCSFALVPLACKTQVAQKRSDRCTRRKPRGGVAALRRTRRLSRTAARWLFFSDLLNRPHNIDEQPLMPVTQVGQIIREVCEVVAGSDLDVVAQM